MNQALPSEIEERKRGEIVSMCHKGKVGIVTRVCVARDGQLRTGQTVLELDCSLAAQHNAFLLLADQKVCSLSLVELPLTASSTLFRLFCSVATTDTAKRASTNVFSAWLANWRPA